MLDPPESGNPSLEGFTHKVSIGAARRAATAQQNGEEVVCRSSMIVVLFVPPFWTLLWDMPLEAQGMLLGFVYNWRFALTAWLCDSMVSEGCKHVGIVAQLVLHIIAQTCSKPLDNEVLEAPCKCISSCKQHLSRCGKILPISSTQINRSNYNSNSLFLGCGIARSFVTRWSRNPHQL